MTRGEKAAITAAANREKRRQREDQRRQDRELTRSAILAVLSDPEANAEAKVKAAEMLETARMLRDELYK